ncbi:MAG TPA: LytTR family DNA-binding domain-containing protein [Methylomusa anaerophila]|uniref:Transcriptional regulatory protein YpdB n=1 Tax=Methylomusa anaerophila TaxID=1930071 RepID=A0A348AQT0_9FIRM|nr:LytTR family DNA-binding domain-containing protein [Methylomusa anaerophila]BBB93428.1 transcriptional regulatory protein YpdB [Methylomusa anaerophila]HML90052.1 LytTR family DNA-binding domain-containing protein [Methylomusa anaerophila]
MLKVIIAEDDPKMRLVLKRTLEEIPNVSIVGEAENGQQLVRMVEELAPEVIFLDVDMPVMNGIEASKEIFDIDSRIFLVFATGFQCFTQEAFEVYAFDYLVKPFNMERVRQTIHRIKELKTERKKAALWTPEAKLVVKREESLKLKVLSNEKSTFINIPDIIVITRKERRTVIYAVGNVAVKTYESLQKLEEQLKDYRFFRCHKGFIINPDMVLEVSPWGNKTYLVKLANTKETALMTMENVKEFQKRYCI